MKACIFDMDGTLVDSIGYWRNGIVEAIESFGEYENVGPVVVNTVNKPIKLCCPYFVEALGMDVTPQELWDRIRSIMEEHYRKDVQLFSGAYETLCELRARGVKAAVVSATDRELVGICLRTLGIEDMFEFYLSCVDYGVGKEDPVIFLDAAKKLGLDKNDICVFDDSLVSLKTAHALGFITAGVAEQRNLGVWSEIEEVTDIQIKDWNLYKESL